MKTCSYISMDSLFPKRQGLFFITITVFIFPFFGMEEAEPSFSTRSSSSSTDDEDEVSSQVLEEEEEEQQQDERQFQHLHRSSELEQQRIGISYSSVNVRNGDDGSAMIRDDTWSCVVVVLTFWFFVSMTLVLGVYGSLNVRLGPNASILLQPSGLFVQHMKVEGFSKSMSGMMLYGFHKSPPLDVVTTWSESHSVILPTFSDKEWLYILNAGSEINISYSLDSLSKKPIILVIAQGDEGIAQWLEDPSYPNSTLSWNLVYGRGVVQQSIRMTSAYYVALGNLAAEAVEVQLNISIRSLLYNTTTAHYRCSLDFGSCSFQLSFLKAYTAVLASGGPSEDTSNEDLYVKLSYGSRWITYFAGIGGMTVFMLAAFKFLNKIQCGREHPNGIDFGQMNSETSPLLSRKDDDILSWGSSYDSVSNDDEDAEDGLIAGFLEGKTLKDGEDGYNSRRICVICVDAPRDCFFLPCGHCVACFTCGTRVVEAAGTCPICCRSMKKVRKIFTV